MGKIKIIVKKRRHLSPSFLGILLLSFPLSRVSYYTEEKCAFHPSLLPFSLETFLFLLFASNVGD